jgi:hypothetical protein
MSTLTSYNGISVVSPEPTAAGGKAINDNFKALSTPLHTTDPGSSDDSSSYFSVGSRWFNTATGVEWLCTDDTVGAAVWDITAVWSINASDGAAWFGGGTVRVSTSGDLFAAGVVTTSNNTLDDGSGNMIASSTFIVGDTSNGVELQVPSGNAPEVDFYSGGSRKFVAGYDGSFSRGGVYNDTAALGFTLFDSGIAAIGGDLASASGNTLQISTTSVTVKDATTIVLGSSTGTKIGTATSQKLGLWNATPVVQPTTSGTSATLVANSGTAINSASTFDGYTLAQIVKALRTIGILA